MRDRSAGTMMAIGMFAVALLGLSGCGAFSNPDGPGSLKAVTEAAKSSEDALKAQGAILERKQYPLGSAWAVDLAGQEVTEKTFEALKKLDHIAELNLSRSKITDSEMKHFSDISFAGAMVDIDVSKNDVSDDGLNQIKESVYLMKLNLAETKVTDEGVARWQKARGADGRVSTNFKKVKITR